MGRPGPLHFDDGGAAVAQLEDLPGIGDVVADKYRIERLLGQGGMGAVFLAQHLVTDKRVALKWMLARDGADAVDIERFIGEARAAARIEHPNIVDIYDVGEHAGSLFLVMEYLRGRPFSDAVKAAPLPPGPTLRSLMPAMRGVHAAHRRGVVHRDLKPDNIFLCFDEDGEALDTKVLDFGISKMRELHSGAGRSLTHTGMVMGTPHYIAPEQAEDAKSVDGRADVYAMGVILYECLGGHVPFDAESLTALLLKITRGDPAPLSDVRRELPGALCSVVMKAISLRPADRFEDMAALMAALAPFAGATPLPLGTLPPRASFEHGSATPLASPSDIVQVQRHHTRAPWLIAVAGLALAGAVLWLVFGADPTAPVVRRVDPPGAIGPAAAITAVRDPQIPDAREPQLPEAPELPLPEAAVIAPDNASAIPSPVRALEKVQQVETPEAAAAASKRRERRRAAREKAAAAAAADPAPAETLAPARAIPNRQAVAPVAPETASPSAKGSRAGRLGIEMRSDQF